jgi:hypothetical protein
MTTKPPPKPPAARFEPAYLASLVDRLTQIEERLAALEASKPKPRVK